MNDKFDGDINKLLKKINKKIDKLHISKNQNIKFLDKLKDDIIALNEKRLQKLESIAANLIRAKTIQSEIMADRAFKNANTLLTQSNCNHYWKYLGGHNETWICAHCGLNKR